MIVVMIMVMIMVMMVVVGRVRAGIGGGRCVWKMCLWER